MKYIASALLLSVFSAAFAVEDTPFRFCGPVSKMVINGQSLTAEQIKKFEECEPGEVRTDLRITVGYKKTLKVTVTGFRFDDTTNTLHVTLKDEKGKLIPTK